MEKKNGEKWQYSHPSIPILGKIYYNHRKVTPLYKKWVKITRSSIKALTIFVCQFVKSLQLQHRDTIVSQL